MTGETFQHMKLLLRTFFAQGVLTKYFFVLSVYV
jgi:hypothetical protein